MLVLSRETGERIIINPDTPDEIVICYLGIRSSAGRIGIIAPSEVVVMREELLSRPRRKEA